MNQGALAHIIDDDIINRIASGEFQSHIARQLGVAPQSLHERISKHPQYRIALECRNTANLDDGQMLIDRSPDLARAREQFKAAAWRAERECPAIWGAKQQLEISGKLSLDALLGVVEVELSGKQAIDSQAIALHNEPDNEQVISTGQAQLPE